MDLIICGMLLGGWLLLLSGGYTLTEAITRRIGQRKNALSGCNQIKRQGEVLGKNSPTVYPEKEEKASACK